MRVVTLKVLAEREVQSWRNHFAFGHLFAESYIKVIGLALAKFDGEDVVGFVDDTRRGLGYANGLLLYCDECDEECRACIEVGFDEGDIRICESCLERALEMLRGETKKEEEWKKSER